MAKTYSKWIILGAAALILVVGGIMYAASRKPKITYDTAAVERGLVMDQVTATGSIAPSSKIKLEAEATGKVTDILLDEGAEVSKGDVILEIDAKDIDAQISAQNAVVASARAKLAELEAGPTTEELALAARAVDTAQSRLDAAKSAETDAMTSLSNAQKKLENTVEKANALIDAKLTTFTAHLDDAMVKSDDAVTRLTQPMYTSENLLSFTSTSSMYETAANGTRSSAKSAVTAITSAVAAAKANVTVENVRAQYAIVAPDLATVLNHLQATVDVLDYSASLSDTTLASYKTNASTAVTNVTGAITTLAADAADLDLQEKLNETDLTSADIAVAEAEANLNAAEHNVDTAKNTLAEAQASLDLKKAGTRPEAVSAQRAVVSAEVAKLSQLQNERDKHRIVAPVDGVVTLIAVEKGETLQAGTQAAIMNAKGPLEIVSNVSEIDIARVQIGDPVDVTLDAFSSSEHWTGKVIAIQPAEKVVDSVIFYETRIRLDEEDTRLRSGMTANLDIIAERRDDVLRVPVRALHEDGDRTYVNVLVNGTVTEERDVTVGLRAVDFAEITSGLQEGEEVVTAQREG